MPSKSDKEKEVNKDKKSNSDGEDSMEHSEVIYKLDVSDVSSEEDV